MSIYDLLEELEEVISEGHTGPFSKRGSIDIKRAERLVMDIKQALPSAIQESSYMLAQKDKIISQAEKQASEIIESAKQCAENLVSNSEIVKMSEERANANIKKADEYVNHLESVTRANIDKLLKAIEDYLMENLHIVRNNREELAGTLLKNIKSLLNKD